MSSEAEILGERTLDSLLFHIDTLKQHELLEDSLSKYLDGDYKAILRGTTSQTLYEILSNNVAVYPRQQDATLHNFHLDGDENVVLVFITGLAAFNAFLQANVTGPPLDLRDVFTTKENAVSSREQCLRSLDVDGVSVYQHIPYIELFCLARMIFTVYFPRVINGNFRDSKWMRMRINAYHQRLLSGRSGGKLSDSTALQDRIERDLQELEAEILGNGSTYSTEAKVQFLLEKAQIYIMEGLDLKAEENVKMAKTISGFSYALSGALGRRTKFQQNDISQLVVFARSKEPDEPQSTTAENAEEVMKDSKLEHRNAPTALELNDDTLLESISFKETEPEKVGNSAMPPDLVTLQPDNQPQLQPLDQITLLTEATLKDSLSPLDKLNSEEILPYAVRVLTDKPTNWQIYTQALLVRSRIESHRSRTQERSVLQLQVIVDQIIADTQEAPSSDGVPEIRVTQFLPRAKSSESAPVAERLRYIYQLNTPTRWELETELAYAWSEAGSLVSALEIFKRLKLWAEVALCYHSVGQEDKARQIVRRQLYHSSLGPSIDQYDVDAAEVAKEKWDGEQRSPPPAHAPRLWCILGDLDQDPTCWQRAWDISKNRFARAQRTLGEYFTRKGDLERAREAYLKATVVNRQNNETWSRLGDLDLAAGNWDGAVLAFQQSIMIDDSDAKTYSNLGSALLSKHAQMRKLEKLAVHDSQNPTSSLPDDEEAFAPDPARGLSPGEVLHQALLAYKRAAAIAHSNWKIWDNVLTISLRSSPPSFPDLLLALRAIIQIRSPSIGEDAVDVDVLRVLVQEVTSRERAPEENEGAVYVPPRGSLARAAMQLVESDVVPLITKRGELWVLVEKLALYRRDYAAALSCAEKAWRVSQGEGWLEKEGLWAGVVGATDHLVSAYENYGPRERADGKEVERGWRMKARSAVRGVMGKARGVWDGTEEWVALERRLEELKSE